MNDKQRYGVILAAALVLPSVPLHAQTLEQRIQALERRVEKLERPGTPQSPQAGTTVPRSKEVWRTLKRGMGMDDVRLALGEPSRMATYPTFIAWHFAGGGNIQFDNAGRITEIHEP